MELHSVERGSGGIRERRQRLKETHRKESEIHIVIVDLRKRRTGKKKNKRC